MSDEPTPTKRFSLLGIIGGLMTAENLGDVHDEINHLCDLAGVERPRGGFQDGWTGPTVELIRGRERRWVTRHWPNSCGM